MFLSVFEGVPSFPIGKNESVSSILDLLSTHTAVFASKGELRRMVKGGGLLINKQKVSNPEAQVDPADYIKKKYLLIQKGKKNYFLITLE
jgi:tyrosyl-tRNA synthetase